MLKSMICPWDGLTDFVSFLPTLLRNHSNPPVFQPELIRFHLMYAIWSDCKTESCGMSQEHHRSFVCCLRIAALKEDRTVLLVARGKERSRVHAGMCVSKLKIPHLSVKI